MTKKLTINQKQLLKAVDEILYFKWDPINISDELINRDEYKSYVLMIFSLLLRNCAKEEICQKLSDFEENEIGLSPCEENNLKIAELLLEYKKEILEKNNKEEVVLKILSIDEIKKALPGYDPKNADEFHSESAKIANKLFDEEIKKLKNKDIILMCGGSASGKTEFLEKFFPEDFDGLVFDSTFSTIEGAKVKIRNIKKSENKPIICLVFPDDLKRAFFAFNKRDRIIPENRFFETHSGARKTALWVAENYPNIEILIYENSYQPGNKEEDELPYKKFEFENRQELIDFLKKNQYNEDEIKKIIF